MSALESTFKTAHYTSFRDPFHEADMSTKQAAHEQTIFFANLSTYESTIISAVIKTLYTTFYATIHATIHATIKAAIKTAI